MDCGNSGFEKNHEDREMNEKKLIKRITSRRYCPKCHKPIQRQSPSQIVDIVAEMEEGKKILLLAPVVRDRKGMHTNDILKCIPTSKMYLKDKWYLDIGTHEGLRYAKQSKLFKEAK